MINNLDLVILHYATQNKKYLLELAKKIKPEYLDGACRDLYSLLQAGYANPQIKDVMSLTAVADYCDRHNLQQQKAAFTKAYEDASGLKLNNQKPQDSDFNYFLNVVRERYNASVVRDAIKRMTQMMGQGIPVAEVNALLDVAAQEVKSITREQVVDEGSVGDDIINIFKEYEAIQAAPDQFRGVMSGFPSLDAITNGFFGSELIIIAGFEGSGKSMLCMNMAVNAWLGSNNPESEDENYADDGKNVLYISLEMPRSNKGETSSAANLNKRIVSCVGKIPNTDMRKGALAVEDYERFRKACKFIKKYDKKKKLYVIDMPRGVTVDDIEAKYLELSQQFHIDLIVVDYIGLMAGAEDEADWEAQGKVAENLHELARVYRVPVISPVQLNRPGAANHSLNKQNYNNTRISRSAMIGQNANIVLVIEYRDNERGLTDMPVHITKMRDGGGDELLFWKDFPRMRITDALVDEAPGLTENKFVDIGDDD